MKFSLICALSFFTSLTSLAAETQSAPLIEILNCKLSSKSVEGAPTSFSLFAQDPSFETEAPVIATVKLLNVHLGGETGLAIPGTATLVGSLVKVKSSLAEINGSMLNIVFKRSEMEKYMYEKGPKFKATFDMEIVKLDYSCKTLNRI